MCTQPVAVKTSSRRTAPGRRGVEARWVHVGFPPSGGRGSVDELTNAAVHELVDQARCWGRVAGALDSSSGRGRRAVRPRPAQQSPTRRRQPWRGRRARQERLRRVRRPCSWMASVVGDLGFEDDGGLIACRRTSCRTPSCPRSCTPAGLRSSRAAWFRCGSWQAGCSGTGGLPGPGS